MKAFTAGTFRSCGEMDDIAAGLAALSAGEAIEAPLDSLDWSGVSHFRRRV